MRAALDLVNHILQPVFKLTLDRCTGLQQAHVQHVNGHALQCSRHIVLGHAQGQSFHYRCFTHTCFTGQDGVVLAATHQDVNRLTDLGVAADHRVDLAVFGALCQVGGELIQRRCFACGRICQVLRCRALFCLIGSGLLSHMLWRALRQLVELVLEFVRLDAGKQFGGAISHLAQGRLCQQGQQQMATSNACRRVLQRGDQPTMLQQHRQMVRENRCTRVASFEMGQLALQVALQFGRRDIVTTAQQ